MQDGDISSTELHKVLQEVKKYRKLKPSQGQNKTDHKRTERTITRTRIKRRQGKFFTTNRKFVRYPGCQCHLKYESLPPSPPPSHPHTAYDFMVTIKSA